MSAIMILVFIIFLVALVIRFYEKSSNAMCQSKKNLHGKTAIVTGGTAGMGLKIATDFARKGAKVIVACPFKEEGNQAKGIIVQKSNNDKIIFKLLDLSSLDSVRKFAADVLMDEERLDILINNAGVGIPKDFETADGMSFIMQVNYFGHFLLTLLLLPLLKKTGKLKDPSRVVNTSSVLHNFGILGLEHLNKINHWFMIQTYAKSKLCLVLFARELTKKIGDANIVINSVDPGAVGTRIFDSVGKFRGFIIATFFSNFYKTPFEGAQTALHVALDQKAGKVSGEFFKNCKQTRAISWAYSDELAKKLWEQSVKCVKLDSDELNKCLL